jgi:hypothetical protein
MRLLQTAEPVGMADLCGLKITYRTSRLSAQQGSDVRDAAEQAA